MSLVFEERAVAALCELGLMTARLQLDTVAQQAAASGWSDTHFLGYLLDGEISERHLRSVELNKKFARFPYPKRITEFDFAAQTRD